jgi:hypothetical protein
MAFESVTGGPRKFVKYKDCVEGQILAEGIYRGMIDGKYGPQHLIRQTNGQEVVLNSSGHLDYLVETHVPKGSMVRVIYSGKQVLEKGRYAGKESHQFDVQLDRSASMPTPEELHNMDVEASPEALTPKTSVQKSLVLDMVDDDEEDEDGDAESILARYRS